MIFFLKLIRDENRSVYKETVKVKEQQGGGYLSIFRAVSPDVAFNAGVGLRVCLVRA